MNEELIKRLRAEAAMEQKLGYHKTAATLLEAADALSTPSNSERAVPVAVVDVAEFIEAACFNGCLYITTEQYTTVRDALSAEIDYLTEELKRSRQECEALREVLHTAMEALRHSRPWDAGDAIKAALSAGEKT